MAKDDEEKKQGLGELPEAMPEDGSETPPESAPEAEAEPYRVGPGHPPKEHQWKKGGKSPHPSGRPKKLKRLPLPLQHHQDVLRALEKPVPINGEQIPFSVLNSELIKRKARAGHAPSMRYLDKIGRESKEYFRVREPERSQKVDQYIRHLQNGDPPNWVAGALNTLSEEFKQSYFDIYVDPKRSERAAKARAEKKMKEFMQRMELLAAQAANAASSAAGLEPSDNTGGGPGDHIPSD